MNFNSVETSAKAQHRPRGQLGGLLARGGKLDQEDDEGAVEYKWRLTSIAPARFEHLVTQMKFRVAEGCGQCVYEIGVDDDGNPRGLVPEDYKESLRTVKRMSDRLGYELTILHERVVASEPVVLKCAELHVAKYGTETPDLRIAMCGSVDSGKSTLVGVLAQGTLDDGCGSVRQTVFNHKHELHSGRTSSVSERVLGFDSVGNITNYDVTNAQDGLDLGTASCLTQTIAERSVKLVTLMDLAGHEKYSKTTLMGFTSKPPGYACVVASLLQEPEVLRKSLQLCHSMRVRYFIVLNKVDRVSTEKLDSFVTQLADLLQEFGASIRRVNNATEALDAANVLRKLHVTRTPSPVPAAALSPPLGSEPAPLDSLDEAATPTAASPTRSAGSFIWSSKDPGTPPMVPVFVVSCVRGDGCKLVSCFLNHLPQTESLSHKPPEILVEQCFHHAKVGLIFKGFVTKGTLYPSQKLAIGPDRRGNFFPVTIASVHVNGANAKKAVAGVEAAFTLHEKLPRALVPDRKGVNLLDPDVAGGQTVCVEFEAEVSVQEITPASGVFAVGQEPMCHCRNIRQAVRALAIDRDELRKGQSGIVRFRFLYHPEVMDIDGVVVFTTRHMRIIGTVTSAQPLSPATANAPSPQMFPVAAFEADGEPFAPPLEVLPAAEVDEKSLSSTRRSLSPAASPVEPPLPRKAKGSGSKSTSAPRRGSPESDAEDCLWGP